MNRKNRIKAYIKTKTEDLIRKNHLINGGVEAQDIAYDLKIDRANVSRELNALWKNGELIKIAGRPVLYLDAETLEKKYSDVYFPSFIPLGSNILSYIDNSQNEKQSSFLNEENQLDNLIGASGSLSSQIDKAKAAVAYPPYGLATIIFGHAGTRKSDLADAMINYSMKIGIRKQDAPYFNVDCRTYSDADSFNEYFFGNYDERDKLKNTKGILQKCNEGFIVLDHIESLFNHSLDLLASTINRNYYYKINSDASLPLRSMLILTTNLSPNDDRIKNLVSYVPIQLTLSDFDTRGAYEKLEQIMLSFSEEAKKIGKIIKVRKDVLTILTCKKYQGNLTQLENEIKAICSNAYLTSSNTADNVDVTMMSLPQEISELSSSDFSEKNQNKVSLLLNAIEKDHILFDVNGYSKDFIQFREAPKESAKHLLSQFIEEFYVDTDSIISFDDYANENIACLNNCSTVQLNALKTNIDPKIFHYVTVEIFKHPQFKKTQEHQELLYGILLHITNSIDRLKTMSLNDERPSVSKDIYPEEYKLSKKIFDKLQSEFDFIATNREIDYLASYLAVTKNYLSKTNIAILVIAHGANTASEMVDYIRKNVSRSYHIDAIDFNEKMQLNDLQELACVKAIELNQGSGVLIVSDMEPLTSIHEVIMRKTGIPSKTVHPLTLSNLVEIVERNISSINDIDTLHLSGNGKQNFNFISDDKDEFIRNITERIIRNTTAFIDCYKAVDVLSVCLNKTLNDLKIQYSNDIAVKYYCHCVSMLERVIKNETWENSRLNKFIASNTDLMNTVSFELEYANSVFGIRIPQTELVYVAEMFLPYLQTE